MFNVNLLSADMKKGEFYVANSWETLHVGSFLFVNVYLKLLQFLLFSVEAKFNDCKEFSEAGKFQDLQSCYTFPPSEGFNKT